MTNSISRLQGLSQAFEPVEVSAMEEDMSGEMESAQGSFEIDNLEEGFQRLTADEQAAEPMIVPLSSEKRRKLMAGVVDKACEGIIEGSTRKEYDR